MPAVAHVVCFAAQQRVFVGMAELFAYLFAVLAFLIHIVGDDGQNSHEGQYDEINHSELLLEKVRIIGSTA